MDMTCGLTNTQAAAVSAALNLAAPELRGSISSAIEAALGVTPTSLFMCDSVPTKQEAIMSNFDPTMARKVRAQLDDDDFEVVDGTEVLKDGRSIRVPLFQMDAAVDDSQRSVMLDTIERERARRFGLRDAADLRKPGFRYNTSDAARDARQEARERYLDELENAWRAPPVGAGERGFGAAPKAGAIPMSNNARLGMSCTVKSGGRGEGSRGVLREVDGSPGWLECVSVASDDKDEPETSRADAATLRRSHTEIMDAEYARYDQEISTAYRKP
jgi:hypothetical protein